MPICIYQCLLPKKVDLIFKKRKAINQILLLIDYQLIVCAPIHHELIFPNFKTSKLQSPINWMQSELTKQKQGIIKILSQHLHIYTLLKILQFLIQ